MFPPPLFWEGELFHGALVIILTLIATSFKACGYPIYLVECSVGSHHCVVETSQPIGDVTLFTSAITLVRNADSLRYTAWTRSI